ncbi:MAG: type II/IV secretion system ATPase subunit [Candidatus Bathyarchaeota archaeon]|nr:type II/IV secretion system ATPase subunit [Candidatus Bathyarchaeota archaeon]
MASDETELESKPQIFLDVTSSKRSKNKKPKKTEKPAKKEAAPKPAPEPTEEKQNITFKDFYSVIPPFGNVGIEVEKATGRLLYSVIEPTMDETETKMLSTLKTLLKEETQIPLRILKDESLVEGFLRDRISVLIKRFKINVTSDALEKFIYYIKRDFLGYGIVDVVIRDQNIEDISCNGYGIPIYVWHRLYESLPSNVVFKTNKELDAFVTRLAYRAGHQISVSNPILEGALPEGFRIQLTLEEVSKRGDTFTIRKVRANPYTIVDLINLGTLPPAMAAYFWLLVENRRSITIAGATASGKTALMNSICSFLRPEMKVVTIEEVRELRLHENWIPMVTRPSVQAGVKEVTLFDLLKSSLRQRPDSIIVGEVRGEEAYTLFQSISVGHGGMCTIHAEDVDSVEKRLLTEPMNIPPMLLPMMNVIALINRTKYRDNIVRRVLDLSEIAGVDPKTERVKFQKLFEWDPRDDTFPLQVDSYKQSVALQKVAAMKHVPIESVVEELEKREYVLKWMARKGLKDYDEVSGVIRKYYVNPGEIYNKARFGI